MRKIGFAAISFLLTLFFVGSTYLWCQEGEDDPEHLKRLKRIEKMDPRLKMKDIDYSSYFTEPHTDDDQWRQETSASEMRRDLEHLEEGLKRFEQNLEIDGDRLRNLSWKDEYMEDRLDLEENIKHEREMIDGIKERTERIRKRLAELEEAGKKMGPDPIERLERERGEIENRLKDM